MSYQDDAITGAVESFGGTPIAAAELLDLGAGAPLFPQPFAIPEDLDAAHVRADGQVLMSTATLSTIDSTNYFGGDIILYDPVADSASLFFSRTNFASSASNVDALFLIESGADAGKLLLSTTATATLGGLTFRHGDVVLYDPLADSASLFFDQDLITGALSQKNIDALHLLEDGDLLLSVSISNGTLGGEKLAREDIVQYDPLTGTTTVFVDGFALFDGPLTANLDAVTLDQSSSTAAPEPGAALLFAVGNLIVAASSRRRRQAR